MVLTDTCKDPEVLIAWADQFYTEEGGILTWLGIEGKTWQMDEDGNWEWIVGQGYGDDMRLYVPALPFRERHTILPSSLISGLPESRILMNPI